MKNTPSDPMKIVAPKPFILISCLMLLTALTHWPSFGQISLFGDLCPGSGSFSLDFDNVEVDGYFYFAANDCVHGEELWRTDGTLGGTEMVADINEGSSGSKPRSIINLDGSLFFSADDGKNGIELWRFDTHAEKAEMVADISNGGASSIPRNMIQYQDQLFFYATTPSHGYELWRSNGTEQGTELVKDIYPGPDSTLTYDMIVANDLLLFWGDDGTHGRELWRSDGTENGTYMLNDIFPGSQHALIRLPAWTLYGVSYPESAQLTRVEDRVFFFASDGIHGAELWSTDGTKTGTVLNKDINPGPASSYPSQLIYTGGYLLLAAADAANGRELRMLDARSFDEITFDVNPGNGHSSPIWITPATNDIVYFSADDGVHGRELWALEGRKDPILVADINSGPSDSQPNNLFFDERPNNSSSQGMLIFTADDGRTGPELWASFLKLPFEAEMIHEFTSSPSGGSVKGYTQIGSTLFFVKYLSWYGFELWNMDVGNNSGSPFLNYNTDLDLDILAPDELPTAFALDQNYPNPFNPSTEIAFTVPESAHVRLSVFDMLGREVHTLVDGTLSAGRHQVTLNADNLPSGTYLYRMETSDFTASRVMHLTR